MGTKKTSMEPTPKDDSWKSQVTINEFEPILKGKGLHRTISTENGVVEGYFFYDAANKKIYSMSVD